MTKEERKIYKRIGNLFRMAMGGGTENERNQAREKLESELKKIGKTFSAMGELLKLEAQADLEEKTEQAAAQGATYDPQSGMAVKPTGIPCIDLVYDQLTRYLDLKDHEFTAVTLWVLHTHVFERFEHTPRLLILSPVADCGKSAVMDVMNKLVAKPALRSGTTPAAIYWLLDHKGPQTMLLDEFDNADLRNNPVLRQLINSGYKRSGAKIDRFIGGLPKSFSVFTPVAMAAINTNKPIPFPILSRSHVISMHRSKKELRRFDSKDTEDLDIVRGQAWLWAGPDLKLQPNPEMPKGLRRGRPRDKWRAMFAIADHFGPHWGERAREAALTFATARHDQDEGVLLLEDTREIFNNPPVDRIFSKVLIERLRALPDAGWDEPPLTQNRFAKIVQAFDPKLKTRVVWPKGGRSRGQSAKGYYREQFQALWDAYCEDEVSPEKENKIKVLRSV